MAGKTLSILALIAMAAGSSLSSLMPECSPENRDCSCADKSYINCDTPPLETEKFKTLGGIEECMLYCNSFNVVGQCDYFIYYDAKADYNCYLFVDQDESMEEYLASCRRTGQPIRRADGSCTASQTPDGECNSLICPQGCLACDENDACNVNYHETGCSMISPALNNMNTPDLDTCLSVCALQGLSNPSTYATFDSESGECSCYETGSRSCTKQVVRAGFDLSSISSCNGGNPDPPCAGCWELNGEDLVVPEYRYTYTPWICPYVSFQGKTTNDIHVSLAPTDGDGDISHPRMDVYEIVIGGFGNTISVIRRGMQGRTLGEAQTPQIDSPGEYRGFWITGEINADGQMEIKVGREGECAFMSGIDTEAPLEWKFTGFAGWPNAVGHYNNICATGGPDGC